MIYIECVSCGQLAGKHKPECPRFAEELVEKAGRMGQTSRRGRDAAFLVVDAHGKPCGLRYEDAGGDEWSCGLVAGHDGPCDRGCFDCGALVFEPSDVSEFDEVDRPSHYVSATGLEALDVIEAFDLGFHLGNVVKYVLRAGRKATPGEDLDDATIRDLRKARRYLDREIRRLDQSPVNNSKRER